MAKKKLSDEARFFQLIAKADGGCWEWQGSIDRDGYGFFKIGSRSDGTRRQVRSHRWSYEHFKCEIPDGLQIDHLCRNRSCANPEHLEAVTNLVNAERGWRANKTECKYGHPLVGANLRMNGNKRACKTCATLRASKWRNRNAEGG